MGSEVSVVVITRNRRASLLRTLDRLDALPSQPPVIVVDNASSDGTVAAVRSSHPEVVLVALGHNAGGAGRTAGVIVAETPYVAFCDDDSWWEPGSLPRAAELFRRHSTLALIAASVYVGAERVLDRVCAAMADSRLPETTDLPGLPILGFLACAAVVRRSAYLEVGGFPAAYGVGGEEAPIAIELALRGWGLCYAPELSVCHHPSPTRDPAQRRRIEQRNALRLAWQRRRLSVALRATAAAGRRALRDGAARTAIFDLVTEAPAIMRDRCPVPVWLEQQLKQLPSGDGQPG